MTWNLQMRRFVEDVNILLTFVTTKWLLFFGRVLDDDLPNDPYMNYILWPHFHFSGRFRADVSTVNNIPTNFDTENVLKKERSRRNWNPDGTNEWSVTGSVTGICYADGTCVEKKENEQFLGTHIQGRYESKLNLNMGILVTGPGFPGDPKFRCPSPPPPPPNTA